MLQQVRKRRQQARQEFPDFSFLYLDRRSQNGMIVVGSSVKYLCGGVFAAFFVLRARWHSSENERGGGSRSAEGSRLLDRLVQERL